MSGKESDLRNKVDRLVESGDSSQLEDLLNRHWGDVLYCEIIKAGIYRLYDGYSHLAAITIENARPESS